MNNISSLNRNHDEAVFLGCGPSINNLNESKLNGKDVWSSNNFYLHKSIVPDFLHLELKEHRTGPTARKVISEKRELYRNTNWILNRNRDYLLNAVKPEWFENIYRYDPNKIKVQINSSITIILQIMASLGYKKIYFAGVDLYDSRYFWSDNPDYDWLKEFAPLMVTAKPDERSPKDIHPNMVKANMAEWITAFLDYNKIIGVNLSSESLLSKYLRNEL